MVDNSSKKCTPGIATRFCFCKTKCFKNMKTQQNCNYVLKCSNWWTAYSPKSSLILNFIKFELGKEGYWRCLCINIRDAHTEHSEHFYNHLPSLLHCPKNVVLDTGSCVALPVAHRPQSTAQIFELKCSQVNLAWSSAFPELWWDASSRAWAFRQAALLASVASLYLASGGFQNRQAGAEGQTATWERTEVSPPSDTDADTGLQMQCC